MVNQRLIILLLLFCLGTAGCLTTRPQRAGAGAGIGAVGGAGLGAIIGSAFGVPGLGALWGAVGGAIVGASTGALLPDSEKQSEAEHQEIEKLAAQGEMGPDQLSEAIKQTNLSPESQDVYMSHTRQISAEARKQGKDVKFYVEPGQGMKYKLVDSGPEVKTATKEELAEATSIEGLASKGEMSYDQLSEAIKQTNLSPEAQDVYMSHAKKITADASNQGKDAKFFIEPGQGMRYVLVDSKTKPETEIAPTKGPAETAKEPIETTPVAP